MEFCILTTEKRSCSIPPQRKERASMFPKVSYRQLEDRLPTGYDYVFTLKAKGGIPDFHELSTDMGKCLSRLDLIDGVTV